MKTILNEYLKEVHEMFCRGDAREESYYISLEKLLVKTAGYLEKPGIHITINPKKSAGGNPDFRAWDGKSKIVGYLEAKKPGTDLDDIEAGEQLKRYKETFPNLVLSDFLEFRFFRDGRLVEKVTVGRPHTLAVVGAKPAVENEETFAALVDKYFSFTFPQNLNAGRLAKELAKRTRFLRDQVIIEELKKTPEETSNRILDFYNAFKKCLIFDLTHESFADLYSQTVTYGLFAARTRCKDEFHRKNAVEFIPRTIGILHDVFEFISIGKPSPQLEWIIDDITEVLASVNVSLILNEFYFEGKGEDPIIHFYETFLSEYDPKLREKRGVYYTPEPVVSFIVKSLDIILKEHFDRADGLADLSIKVLDPAAGTLTFIAEAAKLALAEYVTKYGEGVKENFVYQHLLQNFYAFELMMAPYAVGHLKMSYVFEEMGVTLKDEDRFQLYLTNALEMQNIEQIDLPFMSTLSEESRLAGKIKIETPILVILGNPPYSGHSTNVGEWISREIKEYYKVDGKPLGEKNPKWLQDDYVKFIRFAQWKLEENGEGVLGFITNHGYLDNPTFRGMRRSLMKSFAEIYVLDLHGNTLKKEKCPDGSKDENVFDIRQGVAIVLMVKKKVKKGQKTECVVHHAELWGLREKKYRDLKENDIKTVSWATLSPKSEYYLFIPRGEELASKYEGYIKITDIFPINSVGIVTARDDLTIKWSKKEAHLTVLNFSKMDEEKARIIYNLGKDTRDWKVKLAQADLIESGVTEKKIVPILYRPFDIRYTYYTGRSRGFHCMPRPELMNQILHENIGIISVRQVAEKIFNHVFISNNIIESRITLSNKGIAFIFPLYIYPDNSKKDLFNHNQEENHIANPNISDEITRRLQTSFLKQGRQEVAVAPEDIFYYIYGVLFSNIYRERYAEFLRIDFPRIPFTHDYELFIEIGNIGHKLADIHLIKSKELEQSFSRFEVRGDNTVKKVVYAGDEKRVYINDAQYFSNINKEIWEYQVGGYQVLHKWLKERKGRVLSLEEIRHYIKIARALELTIQYQGKIDDLYPKIEKSLLELS